MIPRLEARGLAVRRSGRAILAGVDLAFQGGGLAAVIGPNGAGKSTLLAALAGLAAPEAGEVLLDGRPVRAWERRALARRRAYLPQNARAEWPLPVDRLVALGLTPQLPPFGELPPAMRDRVAEALAACDLSSRAGQAATTLSGGELARAMLARALVGDPAVLIVDEPIAGLDPRHALDAMARLRTLAEGGVLVIVAAHELALAARFATRIVALREGRLIADGPAVETLTSDLVRRVFDVEARVQDGAVEFLGPTDGARSGA